MTEAMDHVVLGIDPGPKPGIAALRIREGRLKSVTVHNESEPEEVIWDYWWTNSWSSTYVLWVAIEKFVFGRATMQRARKGSHETHAMAEALRKFTAERYIKTQYLAAGNVKPWATDARLREWDIWQECRNGHQRDAARHALYMAQRRGLLPKVGPSASSV